MILELARTLTESIRGPQRKPTVILLSSTVLMAAWWYFGSPQFYRDHIAGAEIGASAAPAVYCFASCFVLLGLVPALIVRFGFGERLSDYGVQLGDRIQTLRTFLMLSPLFVVGGFLSSRIPAVAAYYPINAAACDSGLSFAGHALTYLLFYLGWEFHFRGFLQFGLRDSLGSTNALLVQVMASSMLHLGRPGLETFSAILGAILWGCVAYRTRSLLSGLGQHSVLGITLDYCLCRR